MWVYVVKRGEKVLVEHTQLLLIVESSEVRQVSSREVRETKLHERLRKPSLLVSDTRVRALMVEAGRYLCETFMGKIRGPAHC